MTGKLEVVGPEDEDALAAAAAMVTAFRREPVGDDPDLSGHELAERLRNAASHRKGRAVVVRNASAVVGYSFSEIDESGNDPYVDLGPELGGRFDRPRWWRGHELVEDLFDHAGASGRSTRAARMAIEAGVEVAWRHQLGNGGRSPVDLVRPARVDRLRLGMFGDRLHGLSSECQRVSVWTTAEPRTSAASRTANVVFPFDERPSIEMKARTSRRSCSSHVVQQI